MYSLTDVDICVYSPMDVVFLFMVQATFVYSPGDDFVVLKLESVTNPYLMRKVFPSY